MASKLAKYLIIVLATLTVLLLAWQIKAILAVLALSILISAVLRSPIQYFDQRGYSAGFSVGLVYLLLALFLGLLVYLVGTLFLQELQQLADDALFAYQRFQSTLNDASTPWMQTLHAQMPSEQELAQTLLAPESELVETPMLWALIQQSGYLLSALFLATILSIYWTVDKNRFERLWLSLLPPRTRIQARSIWRDVETQAAQYVQSELFMMLFTGTLLGLCYALLGLPYPIMLALLSAFAAILPFFSLITIAVISAGIGIQMGWLIGLAVGALSFLIIYLGYQHIKPAFLGKRRYSLVLSLILMLILSQSIGLIGLLIAPLLALVLDTAVSQLFQSLYIDRSKAEDQSYQLNKLQSRLADVENIYRQSSNGFYPPEIGNIIKRLQKLMQQANSSISKA